MASIKKRSESSYLIIVSCGYEKSGKKITKTKTINLSDIPVKKRDSEAEKQAILFENEVKKGQYIDNERITFEQFTDKWLTDYANVSLQPKTLHEYQRLLNRILPAIGHIKLVQLQPTHLIEFYNNLREDGIRLDKKYTPKVNFFDIINKLGISRKDLINTCNISNWTVNNLKKCRAVQSSIALSTSKTLKLKPEILFDIKENTEGGLSEKTILHHHRLISGILTSALQWGFIMNNPALRVKAPKITKKEASHFDIEQTKYILKLIDNEPIKYKTMITLAIYGGMREGELNALTWDDIDMENCIVKIDKSLQHLPGKDTFVKSTKTENTRIISLPEPVIGLLKEFKKWQNSERLKQGNLWKDSNNLFTALDGGFIFPSTISKWFLNFIRKHNKLVVDDATMKEEDKPLYMLPEVNFHGLRHTSATLLINQGVDISTVSKRLGHARTSTTMDIYSHSLLTADTEASDKLDDLFNNKKMLNKKQG